MGLLPSPLHPFSPFSTFKFSDLAALWLPGQHLLKAPWVGEGSCLEFLLLPFLLQEPAQFEPEYRCLGGGGAGGQHRSGLPRQIG